MESLVPIVSTVCSCTASAAFAEVISDNEEQTRCMPQPCFHRSAIIKPLGSESTTAWRQLLTSGSSSDLSLRPMLTEDPFFDLFLPKFSLERAKLSFRSPYRTGSNLCGRKCSVSTGNILGFVLWRLKSSGRQNQMSPILGLAPSTVSVWPDYGLRLLCRA